MSVFGVDDRYEYYESHGFMDNETVMITILSQGLHFVHIALGGIQQW